MTNLSDFHILVRSVHERTEPLCLKLLTDFFGSDNLSVVHESPFSKALKVSFEIGVDQGKKWLLCVDADVLISNKGVLKLLDQTTNCADNVFEIQGKMIDQFFGGIRGGGIHIYRASLLPDALAHLSPKEVIRPENYVIMQMLSQGNPYVQTEDVIGIHDYGQYYKDIYRKAVVHGRKHAHFLEVLIPYWRRAALHSLDFKVALKGIEDSKDISEDIVIDVNSFPFDIKTISATKKLTEKSPIKDVSITLEQIDEFIESFASPYEYYRFLDLAAKSSNNIPDRLHRCVDEARSTAKRLFRKSPLLPI